MLAECENLLNERAFIIHSTDECIEVSSLADAKGTIIKGRGMLCDCKPEEVLHLFLSVTDEERARYDRATKTIAVLEEFEKDGRKYRINQYILNSPGMY